MGIYIDSDIKSSFEGDIELSSKGDLKLANPSESFSSVLNFIMRTDPGQYRPNPSVGANLGFFVGEKNDTETHEEMEESINQALSRVFDLKDFRADVTSFSQNEAMCVVFLKGTYLIDNEFKEIERMTFTYGYPYIKGSPTILYTDLK